MQSFPLKNHPVTTILRHKKENLNKCSLRGLENRAELQFFRYPKDKLPFLENTILLTLDGEVLTENDAVMGLLLLDGTWRYATKMYQHVTKEQKFIERSLPKCWKTAYPRRQEDCSDPAAGLSSVEALYAAYTILGWNSEGLLDNYYWKRKFLSLNQKLTFK